MPPFDTGCVRIRLACADGRVSAVHINCERPNAAIVLCSRTADQAVQLVPLLFALCGQAQASAAVLALAAARGDECHPRLDSNVQCEVLREHLWRCLIDLPPLLGEAALQKEFVSAVKWIAAGNRDELGLLLTSAPIDSLRQCLRQSGEALSSSHALLPPLDAKNSLGEWPRLSAEFCRFPNWRGKAVETGALARHTQNNELSALLLSARWMARFDELRDWATGREKIGAVGTVSAVQVAAGVGRSLVETARGLLMHEIVLDGECIAAYSIVAPTEWNFHPQGALMDYLLGQDAVDRDVLQQQVSHAVAALDPCVPWELEWS